MLAKPISSREIAARIRAIRRRLHASPADHTVGSYSENPPARQVFGRLCVDIARREVFLADEQISLTRTEFEILAMLAQRPGAVTTRQEMLDAVWGSRWAGSITNIHVHIGHLRRKIGRRPPRQTTAGVERTRNRLPFSCLAAMRTANRGLRRCAIRTPAVVADYPTVRPPPSTILPGLVSV